MEILLVSEWLNNFFAGYDRSILEALHKLAESASGIFTPLFNFISLLAEKGLLFLLIAIGLMLFKKTRKVGVCIFGAVCCGALITNIALKDLIARPRPFMEVTSEYNAWWQYVGSIMESGFSFPSGHVTATMAFTTGLFLTTNKKKSWPIFLLVILMGLSRNYLMVHYPSDVLGALIVGFVSGVIAYYITKAIFKFSEKHKDNKFCNFVLNFNIIKG